MKLFLSLLLVNLSQAILTIRFLVCVCGVTALLFVTSYGTIDYLEDVKSVVMLSGGGNFTLVVGIIPLIPFALTFASEWEERASSFWIIRAGVSNYAICKVIAGAVSSVLVTFLGIWLYAVLLMIKIPFFTNSNTGDAYAPLLEAGQPVLYLLGTSAHLALSSAIFGVAALWISTFIPNRFTAIALPVVVYFVCLRLTRFWELPPYMMIGTIMEGTYHAGTPLMAFLFKLMTVILLCLLMGYGTVVQMRRRVQND
ncbi:hypothetical protein [Paenibacillus arenosi]|uniref:ABC transporter permease n=1 Tax=Paenibacillus arenosi TaxID=2774142 RepID=A0ABR9AZI5_9BACL|nr:hypothetical protein [Paenibacillus arenosi]MBD8499500.1 hypothetical protein [Paenibacillus arenosi]